MVLWSELKDQFPEVEAFPANTNDALFVTLQNLSSRQYCYSLFCSSCA